MADKPMYSVKEAKGGATINLDTLRTSPIATFEIIAQDGEVARRYSRPVKMRGIVKRQAEVMCARYEAHYIKTGKRFELQQKAKRMLVQNKARIEYLEKHIPKLQEELERTRLLVQMAEAET